MRPSPASHFPSLPIFRLCQSILINNNFKMINQKRYLDEQETFVGSPEKASYNTLFKEDLPNDCISLERALMPTQMSETEANLYSRDLVRNIFHMNQHKTIRHEINQISKDSRLYARPTRYNPKEFHFQQIPPSNPHYYSSCSAKIKSINRGLNNQSTSKTKNTSATNHSFLSSDKAQPRVSISGLVSCKFNSVNAQRSLGFNQINHEQTMKQAIKNSQKASHCGANRFRAILQKTSHQRYRELLRKQANVSSNFSMTTSNYLKQRVKQDEQEMLIYGQKAKKLNYIKEYMLSQKANYEEGNHIIDQIQKLRPKEQEKVIQRCLTEADEDRVFEERRMPVKKRRVKVRFITFCD